MEYRVLDLTVISAKDLKNVNLFSKMDVYAVVSLAGDPRTIQRSPVDAGSGKNPTWNFPARFSLDESALQANRLVLHFVLRSDRSLGDKDIGEVHVPVKELLDAAPGKDAAAQSVSYQVRRPSGKPKGVLNISYKFGDKIAAPPAAAKGGEEPVTAYPAGPSASPHYPPPGSAAPYAPPPPGAYPPQQAGYGYPPQPAGYGYPPPGAYPPAGYGYGAPPVQAPAKKNKFGMGLGAGLLGGALGGLLIGDMVSDAAAYDSGYDAGFGDGGGFDF